MRVALVDVAQRDRLPLVQARGRLVQRRGELERQVDALARGLARLRVARDGDAVFDRLDEDLVLVALLPDVAYGGFGEGALGDVALGGALIEI